MVLEENAGIYQKFCENSLKKTFKKKIENISPTLWRSFSFQF